MLFRTLEGKSRNAGGGDKLAIGCYCPMDAEGLPRPEWLYTSNTEGTAGFGFGSPAGTFDGTWTVNAFLLLHAHAWHQKHGRPVSDALRKAILAEFGQEAASAL